MRTPALLAISVAGFGFALWLARGGDAPASPASAGKTVPHADVATATASAPAAALPRPFARVITTASGEVAAPVRKLDPRTDRFRNRVDEQIPNRLSGLAAKCYKGNLQKDQRLDLTYRLHVAGGVVTIGDIKKVEDTINDPTLEQCITDTLVKATWRDDELPDMNEEDELYMRAENWANYQRDAEDDDIGG
jgi:hypothetical protein